MRILVTGSRKWSDWAKIEQDLCKWGLLCFEAADLTVVHGACETGADAIADKVAKEHGFTVESHPADWAECGDDCPQRPHRKMRRNREYCPLAGNRRNSKMVALGADVCLAYPTKDSRGTWDCVNKAKAAGIRVIVAEEARTG